MKKYLISFGTKEFKLSLRLLRKSAYEYGQVDHVRIFTNRWLYMKKFWYKNKDILIQKRGAGYWIWKPYILLETLKELNEGDMVMYCDASVMILSSLEPLFYLASSNEKGVALFQTGGKCKASEWTKRDTFVLMNCDENKYWNSFQVAGGYHIWKKTKDNQKLLQLYLKYLQDYRIVTDSKNEMGKVNFPDFLDHRHDQSVLSLLAIKFNLPIYRDPSQFGNTSWDIESFKNSKYSQLLLHHRLRL